MSVEYDLVIIGGGIGGSALASVMVKSGARVLLLEKSTVYEDLVRGEWIAPWGVVETQRVGLYDLLRKAGGHHLKQHVTYDETLAPALAEAAPMPLDAILPNVDGPLCIGHPHHCQTLFDEARTGATALRGVEVGEIKLGDKPSVTYTVDGKTTTATARLIIGADGRASAVRAAAHIVLHQNKPHHMFGGMLVEDAGGWNATKQAIGTEGDFAFLAFPQGDGRVRVYGSYALDDRRRFAGEGGERAFLDAFRMDCSPENVHLAAGKPAGPLRSYFNNDSWTDEPFAEGVVLIGDAAGWNDPIIGQGLSITYRDVRIVSELLKGAKDWNAALFAPYAEERAERMRRLRFAAEITSSLDAEFGDGARARRRSYFERAAADPMLSAHAIAVMAGPEALPPELFTPEHRARVLEG
ncbi:MAG: FAD-dependent monooxygenase [Parvibaculum sp.]|uniref:FAD-dependent oxidoreductase n=1 Tax=Parvibaculum sp. TaxID=2024848 RepID=UPI0025D4CAA8|nr:NAD(P)/FAD-dependent oxidoreductase [Parvibaculum sp.]MCE9650937.1 FAD-dependent monooxygenase [Parvibaculum sp.]